MVSGYKDTLRVPWTARSNQSTLKEISSEFSLEGLMLKLKLQHFDQQMRKADSWEKTVMLGDWRPKENGRTEDDMVCEHNPLYGHELEQHTGDSGDLEPCFLQSTGLQRVGYQKTLFWYYILIYKCNCKTEKIFQNQYWRAVHKFLILQLLKLSSLMLYSLNIWISEPPLQLEYEHSIRKWTS